MSRPPLSKDTTLCISLAARPSNIGTRFHNYLYEQLGLDFVYKAFTTSDLAATIGGVRALAIQSVNTIVNDAGVLSASNTDYIAVQRLIAEHQLDPAASVLINGSGGMAKAVGSAFRDNGFQDGIVVARNPVAGPELAERLGYHWRPHAGGAAASILVNVTPVGMAGGVEEFSIPFGAEALAGADTVFDVIALPAETPLIVAARTAGKHVITGAEVIALQAAEQFERYTGVRPTPEQVAEAALFSRS